MPDIHIHREHHLGFKEARKVAFSWAEKAEEKFDMECTYEEGDTEDLLTFTRTGVKGTLLVDAAHLQFARVADQLALALGELVQLLAGAARARAALAGPEGVDQAGNAFSTVQSLADDHGDCKIFESQQAKRCQLDALPGTCKAYPDNELWSRSSARYRSERVRRGTYGRNNFQVNLTIL